jgi:pyrimidine operon attenuation protein/uracil phosphoribosyltransferase
MEILNERQILQKIKRIAIEILERNFDEKEVILAGINNNGYGFAQMLEKHIIEAGTLKTRLTRIQLNPASPADHEISIGIPLEELKEKTIIIVDDVANTGRTAFFAMQPLLEIIPKKVEVAVLVNRKHKAFPISSNYVGLSLATTLNENIYVRILGTKKMSVHLN